MVLGMTDTLKPNLQSYTDWIKKGAADVDVVPLSMQLVQGHPEPYGGLSEPAVAGMY